MERAWLRLPPRSANFGFLLTYDPLLVALEEQEEQTAMRWRRDGAKQREVMREVGIRKVREAVEKRQGRVKVKPFAQRCPDSRSLFFLEYC